MERHGKKREGQGRSKNRGMAQTSRSQGRRQAHQDKLRLRFELAQKNQSIGQPEVTGPARGSPCGGAHIAVWAPASQRSAALGGSSGAQGCWLRTHDLNFFVSGSRILLVGAPSGLGCRFQQFWPNLQKPVSAQNLQMLLFFTERLCFISLGSGW